MATYGDIRLRLSKLCTGVDLELIDGWISDVYTHALDRLPWKRLEREIVLQAPASYTDGTIAVTQGSASIVGTGTAWSAAMNGRIMRVSNREEFYQLTVLTTTTATLDRPYEGPDDAEATYRVDQSVFVLPATARVVRAVLPLHDREKPLDLVPPSRLDRISPQRNDYGVPRYAAPYWDSAAATPRMQLDLHPIPQSPNDQGVTPSWSVDLICDASPLDANATSTSLLPWVRESIIIEGVMAKAKRHGLPDAQGNRKPDYVGANEHKKEYESLLATAAQINAQQRGSQQIRMGQEYEFRAGMTKAPRPYSKNFDDLVDD